LFINFGEELGAGSYDSLDADPVDVFTDENPLLAAYEAFADTRLESNHRCPEPVIRASNEVIENNEVRTEKHPAGVPGGDDVAVHHLGCDTFGNKLNESMTRTIEALVDSSPFPEPEIQVLLRQKDGDPAFYYPLKRALPDGVDIRTAHDAKGSEAEHVIITKVVKNQGFPSIQNDKWVDPVKRPPEIYEKRGVSYRLEAERRLFYVALTRAKTHLDVLTVEGAESVFIDELPDSQCEHVRPLPEEELTRIETEGTIRRSIDGTVYARPNDPFATFDWNGRGLVDLNLYDATRAQRDTIDDLAGSGQEVTLTNCEIEFRPSSSEEDQESYRLQLQLDPAVTIQQK
jgi:DNA helicase-4